MRWLYPTVRFATSGTAHFRDSFCIRKVRLLERYDSFCKRKPQSVATSFFRALRHVKVSLESDAPGILVQQHSLL